MSGAPVWAKVVQVPYWGDFCLSMVRECILLVRFIDRDQYPRGAIEMEMSIPKRK